MKLYVCWGTFPTPRPGGHPCRNAYRALREAGWEPELEKVYGWGALGDTLNPTRAKIRSMTGQNWVPVLEPDDGELVEGSTAIVEWARAHRPPPTGQAPRGAGGASPRSSTRASSDRP